MSFAPPRGAPPERDLLRTLASGTAGVVGEGFLRSLARHLAGAFEADVAFVAEASADGDLHVVASWPTGGELPEGRALTRDDDLLGDRREPDSALAVPLTGADGEPVGLLGVLATEPLEVDDEERAALGIFAARAAAEIERRRHQAALRHRELDLAASRARLLEAADDERRRIGRDLHDGAQQHLVALSHSLALAHRRLASEPAAAAPLLEQAREQAAEAGRELRELARGLHPADLLHGLRPALEALAERTPVPVRIVAFPERPLPGAVELTLYYLVAEGVTNAAKHAQAREVTVRVEHRGPHINVAVADDGVGGAVRRGSGLRGLTDRVETLGGTLVLDSPPGGGTRLEATIPTAPWRSAREPFLEIGHADDGGRGEASIERILDGRKTVVVSLAREWELEGGPPRIGQRLPVLDSRGRRRATIEIVRVAVQPFTEIGEDVVAADHGDEADLEGWRTMYRRFHETCRHDMAALLGEPGWRLTDEEPVVTCWFRLAAA